MGKMSRDKGARFERLLASKLRDYGFDARRTAQHSGANGFAPDVVGLPGIHIEAKHVERLNLYDAMAQAISDSAGTENLPAVFHKRNHCDILVTMRFDDWMQVAQSYLIERAE